MASAQVFIEGNYYRLLLKHFYGAGFPRVGPFEFGAGLAREQGLRCTKVFYYTAPPHQSYIATKREKSRRAAYDRAVQAMGGMDGLVIREGRCQKIMNDAGKYEYREKGVDALIIMDLYGAMKETKNVILMSSDTDLMPIVREVRDNGKLTAILYYYADAVRRSVFPMPHELIAAASWSALVNKGHFERSMKRELVQKVMA